MRSFLGELLRYVAVKARHLTSLLRGCPQIFHELLAVIGQNGAVLLWSAESAAVKLSLTLVLAGEFLKFARFLLETLRYCIVLLPGLRHLDLLVDWHVTHILHRRLLSGCGR
jgi:hypothetical protein